MKHMSYLFTLGYPCTAFSTTKKSHITASKVDYHMTQLAPNNKPLNQLFPQNLTNYKIYHSPRLTTMMMLVQIFLLMSSPTLSHFPNCSLATKLQRPLFQLSHWSPEHMAHYNLLLAYYHSRNSYNLACLCDIKITHYMDKTLLNFVEICFPIHCHTISVLSLYFHVCILCALYQNLTSLEIIYVNCLADC